MLRPLVWPLIVLLAAMLPGSASAQPASQRIVAVGDLHGDNDAWLAIARAARVIDGKGRWAGGRTILVQVGDIVDRGPDSLKIIRHLMRLQREAPRRGGRVIVLVGNHEAMMMTGDLRYVHPGEYAAFADRNSDRLRTLTYEANKEAIEAAYRARMPEISPAAIRDLWIKDHPLGKLEHQMAWRPERELGQWAASNPALVKIGTTLFVHGGVSAAYATIGIDEINRRVAAALKAQDKAPASIIDDPRGPLWYRGHVTRSEPLPAASGPPQPTIEEEIEIVRRAYGVERIVVGHTPSREGIIADQGGKLWRIDSANSTAYGGTPSYLEIVGDKVVPHAVPRPAANAGATH